jgi:single-strand DNA-binding protein
MNSVQLQGNVTRDAEVKTFSSGNSVVEFGVAVNRRVKKGDQWVDETDYFDVKSWGKKVPSKGDAVLVEGELRQERWESEGSKRSKVVVNANRLTVFSGYKQGVSNVQEQQPELAGVGTSQGDGEDIPF